MMPWRILSWNGLLAGLQHRVETADDGHGKDHVAVLAANVDIAEDVVGDTVMKLAIQVRLGWSSGI
jgi:hypothetical protein